MSSSASISHGCSSPEPAERYAERACHAFGVLGLCVVGIVGKMDVDGVRLALASGTFTATAAEFLAAVRIRPQPGS
jgi:hypothetical protein